jgi:hypothetical protein
MLNQINISERLFWDTDIESIDPEKHAQFIIGRAVMKGTMADWKEIKRFYGLARIKNEMLSIRYLDKITLSFLSTYFNTPKEEFRCYTMSQSHPKLWDY